MGRVPEEVTNPGCSSQSPHPSAITEHPCYLCDHIPDFEDTLYTAGISSESSVSCAVQSWHQQRSKYSPTIFCYKNCEQCIPSQVYSSLQQLNLCMSYGWTLKLIDRFCKDHDLEVQIWVDDLKTKIRKPSVCDKK